MFDKEAYWKRRKNEMLVEPVETTNSKGEVRITALRGQGDPPVLSRTAVWSQEDFEAGKCPEELIGKERVPQNMEWRIDPKVGMVAYPRRDRRWPLKDRNYTRRGFRAIIINGKSAGAVRIGSRQSNIHNHYLLKAIRAERLQAVTDGVRYDPSEPKPPQIKGEYADPKLSNHERMQIRKAQRDFRRDQIREAEARKQAHAGQA